MPSPSYPAGLLELCPHIIHAEQKTQGRLPQEHRARTTAQHPWFYQTAGEPLPRRYGTCQGHSSSFQCWISVVRRLLGKALRRTRAPRDQLHEDQMSDPYVFLWAKPKMILNCGRFFLQRYPFPEAEMLHLWMQAIYHRETIFWAKSLLLMSLFLNGPSGVTVNELSRWTTIFPPAA